MTTAAVVDSLNRKTMRSSVMEYRWTDELEVHEQAALATVADKVRDKRILDLGVGAGRTVKGLRSISRDYIGVDYVREMVEHCRSRFPDARFEVADGRKLTRFADASFDLVVFACNGIGMVDHDGRTAVLREVHRVLAPGGFFVFSTVNLSSAINQQFLSLPSFALSLNPLKLLARSVRFAGGAGYRLMNRLRYLRHEVRTEDYAILNAECHEYRTMLYFITLENQRRQLDEMGFKAGAKVFDLSGHPVENDTPDGTMTFVVSR